MDATTASLIGTAFGALAGLGGGLIAGRQRSKLEYQKWLQTQEDEYKKEVRIAVAELTKKLSIGAHIITWYTFRAKNEPSTITKKERSEYDKAFYALYPDIVSSRITIAALNNEIHIKMTPLVETLYTLEAKTVKAFILFRSSRREGINELAKCFDEAIKFENELIDYVTEIIGLDNREIHSERFEKKSPTANHRKFTFQVR